MADFAAPTPEDDQQPAASAEVSAEASDQVTPPAVEATIAATEPALAVDPTAATSTDVTDDTESAETVPVAVEPVTAPPEPEAAPVIESTPSEPIAPVEQPVASVEPAAPVAEAPSITPPVIDSPSIASTIEVPASAPAEASGEGGEWELLVEKLTTWVRSGELRQQWQAARTPLSLLAGLIALLLVLRIYSALLAVIEGLPLLPGLLELVGVIAVVRFSLTRLVRSDERQQLIQGLQQRWKSFRGQG